MVTPCVPGSMSAQLLTLPAWTVGATAAARAVPAPAAASVTATPITVSSARRRDPRTARSVVQQKDIRFLSSGRRVMRRHPHMGEPHSPKRRIRRTDVQRTPTVVQKEPTALRLRSTVVQAAVVYRTDAAPTATSATTLRSRTEARTPNETPRGDPPCPSIKTTRPATAPRSTRRLRSGPRHLSAGRGAPSRGRL